MTPTSATPTPTIRQMICRLQSMPIGKVREALDLLTEIERADRDSERLRRAQAARSMTRTAAFEALRVVLKTSSDFEKADLIVSRIETSLAPAFVPPPVGNVIVQHRRRFAF